MELAEGNHLLTTLSHSPDEVFVQSLNESEQIVDDLRNENSDIRVQTIELFRRYFKCLHQLPTSNLPSRLTFYIRNLNTFFGENISQVDAVLQSRALPTDEALSQIVDMLRQNTHVLMSIDELTRYLGAQQSHIKHTGDAAVEIVSLLLTTFQHCRKYEHTYKSTDSAVSELITGMFQKCNEIQCQFFLLLNNLQVDCNCDEQLKLVVVILLKIFDIGVAVSNLNLKTMALVWKGFTSLLKSYSGFLNDKFDVTKIIQFFCTQMTEKIGCFSNGNVQFTDLDMKILSFSLKIIVKLCECFVGNLEASISRIVQLILCLYDCSVCAKFCNVSAEISEAIDRYLLAGVDPLISVLLCDENFAKYIVSATDQLAGNRCDLGALLLLCTIQEKLISGNDDVRTMWLRLPILDTSMNLIQRYHKSLCYDLRIATAYAPRQIYLYDALVVNVSSLIIHCVSCEQFHDVEDTLMTHLLRAPLLVKLFITDVWCIIARFGSSELCFEHVDYLIRTLNEFQSETTETVVVSSLIQRLFGFLPAAYQQRAIKLVRSPSLAAELQRAHCSASELMSRNTIGTIVENFATKKCRNATADELLSSLSLVDVSAVSHELFLRLSKDFVLSQWPALVDQLVKMKVTVAQFAATFTLLCSVTSSYVSVLSSCDLVELLRLIETWLKCESIYVKLNLLIVLEALGPCDVDGAETSQFCNRLGSVFKVCLNDHNCVVEQQAIETFAYFSHTTKYLPVIQKTTENDSQLKRNLAAYLTKQARPLRENKTFEHFILDLFEQSAKCPLDDHTGEENAFKRLKLDNITDKINRAESIINDLLISVNSGELNEDQKNSLRNVIKTVNQFEKYL